MRRIVAVTLGALAIVSCGGKSGEITPAEYLNTAAMDSALSGGSTLTRIATPRGRFSVWTKRVGNNPRIKVLLLHGGPGATHEYFEAMDTYFPSASIEYYYYDQLGSGFSEKPEEPELWDLPRFVDEVEQVRMALKLDKDSFYLFGHSWGGMLAIEYALQYQDHLKGLVISNMMASIPAYNEYAQKVLMAQMDPAALKIIKKLEADKKYDDPQYEGLLIPNFYAKHILRMPYEDWPDPVVRTFAHLNKSIYVPMQGPSELGLSGKLEKWDRVADLPKITVPTLVIGAKYDTMDPAHMEMMSKKFPKGRFLLCPEGSHLALYDDQQVYFTGLIKFIKDVDAGKLTDVICPTCHRRYKWYETTCPEDGATLVEHLPGMDPEAPLDLVTVFTTKEAGLLPLAEMALRDEQIEYVIHYGTPSVPMITRHASPDLNYPVDGTQIVVRRDDAQRAHDLLVDLEQAGPVEASTLEPTPDEWQQGPRGNIELIDSDTRESIGRVTEEQLQSLKDALEEDAASPDEYHFVAGTIDLLEDQQVDPQVIAMLRKALGNRDGIQVRWTKD